MLEKHIKILSVEMTQESTKMSRNKELGQAFNARLYIVHYIYAYSCHNNAMNMYMHNTSHCIAMTSVSIDSVLCIIFYYLVISADISILLWFCTCYKSLPSVLIFSSIRHTRK